MAAVVSLIAVVTLGLLVTRIATVALTMTGMSLDHARFQARSAFTGTGFTTSEAEAIVAHPARRRIVMTLMLVSGAGAVSVLGTLILSFAGVDSTSGGVRRAAVIVAALTALLWLAKSRPVDRVLRRVIERGLRRFTSFDVRDYAALLHLRGQWGVAQVPVAEDDWIASRPLGRLRLPEEGVTVLGVERAQGSWVGVPSENLQLQVGDVVVMYGRKQMLEDIAARLHGDEGEAASERFRAWHAASPAEEPLTPPDRPKRSDPPHPNRVEAMSAGGHSYATYSPHSSLWPSVRGVVLERPTGAKVLYRGDSVWPTQDHASGPLRQGAFYRIAIGPPVVSRLRRGPERRLPPMRPARFRSPSRRLCHS